MYFVALHGQATSAWPGSSGAPMECMAATYSASEPIVASTAVPVLAITFIETTTYGESVISTPNIGFSASR
jgi:hypothetical protein